MKVKNLFIVVLTAASVLLACTQKEELFEPSLPEDEIEEEEIVPEEGFSYVFKIASEDTKSIFGDNHIVWENGDQVASYASTSKNKSTDVEVDGSDVTITIRSSVALSAGDMVYAYAPYNKVNNEAEATAVTL
ncbi:MAG: hypothetical protein J5702_08125, partial [Bacteroidales bacterium]|nr:hypothetical protein [Bacteroidales bacterium]